MEKGCVVTILVMKHQSIYTNLDILKGNSKPLLFKRGIRHLRINIRQVISLFY